MKVQGVVNMSLNSKQLKWSQSSVDHFGCMCRPRRLRKAEGFDCDDLKENCDPVAPSTKKVTPSRQDHN